MKDPIVFVHEASVLWQSSVPLAHSSVSMERRIPLYTLLIRFGALLRISASSLTMTSCHVCHEFMLSSYCPVVIGSYWLRSQVSELREPIKTRENCYSLIW